MGFLEEIKKEAGAGTNDHGQASDDVLARREAFSRAVQPAMRSLYEYLHELAEHLSRVQPDMPVSYDVRNCKGLAGLRQREFHVSVDSEELIKTCTFRFSCSREVDVEFYVPDKEACERQQQYLWNHKLRFSCNKAASDQWVFKLEPYVPVCFEFDIDGEKRSIRLKVLNHERLGTDSYGYDVDDINPLYLDELAKYIMRKPNRFHELSGDEVSEDTLNSLRRQVAERKAKREEELEAQQKKPMGVAKKGLLKGLFKK